VDHLHSEALARDCVEECTEGRSEADFLSKRRDFYAMLRRSIIFPRAETIFICEATHAVKIILPILLGTFRPSMCFYPSKQRRNTWLPIPMTSEPPSARTSLPCSRRSSRLQKMISAQGAEAYYEVRDRAGKAYEDIAPGAKTAVAQIKAEGLPQPTPRVNTPQPPPPPLRWSVPWASLPAISSAAQAAPQRQQWWR
jgi:hypothetical protein